VYDKIEKMAYPIDWSNKINNQQEKTPPWTMIIYNR